MDTLNNLFFLTLVYLIYLLFCLHEFTCILRNKMRTRIFGLIFDLVDEILCGKFIYIFLGDLVFLGEDRVWPNYNHRSNIRINRNSHLRLISPW